MGCIFFVMAAKTNDNRLPTVGTHHKYNTRKKLEIQKHSLNFYNKIKLCRYKKYGKSSKVLN